MRLVRLSDGCYVNPDDVQELTVNSHSNTLTVRMRNGIGHSVGFDYGKTIYDTLRRLRAELEGASKRLAPEVRPADDITLRLDNLAQSLAGEYPPHTLMDLAEAASLITTLRRQINGGTKE